MFNWLDNERSPLLSYLIGTENKWRRGRFGSNLLVSVYIKGRFSHIFLANKGPAAFGKLENVPRVSLLCLACIWWNLELLNGVQMLLEGQVIRAQLWVNAILLEVTDR